MKSLNDTLAARPIATRGLRSTESSVGRQLLLLIVGTALLRVLFAATTGLGVDESYMVSAGRVLSLGYFDHPPAAWWLSWAAAHLAGTEAPVVVRLPFIALFALSTWLMARLGSAVAGPRAGLWAAVLLNLSPVFGITTGTWVLPDGPLDCALLGSALCLVHALPARDRAAWGWWGAAGLCAGLALFSKYTAGTGYRSGRSSTCWRAGPHRAWLARPQPYAAAVLALLVFSPVLVWNATHHWASFAFQGGRAEGLRFHPFAPIGVLAGEALFVLPWIWVPMMAVWIATLRRGSADWRRWLLCWLGMLPIVLFAAVALWSNQRILYPLGGTRLPDAVPAAGRGSGPAAAQPDAAPGPDRHGGAGDRGGGGHQYPTHLRLAGAGDPGLRAQGPDDRGDRLDLGPHQPGQARAAASRRAWSACRTGGMRARSPMRSGRT